MGELTACAPSVHRIGNDSSSYSAFVEGEHEDDDKEMGVVMTAVSGGLHYLFDNL